MSENEMNRNGLNKGIAFHSQERKKQTNERYLLSVVSPPFLSFPS
jgi:hypothetical protein